MVLVLTDGTPTGFRVIPASAAAIQPAQDFDHATLARHSPRSTPEPIRAHMLPAISLSDGELRSLAHAHFLRSPPEPTEPSRPPIAAVLPLINPDCPESRTIGETSVAYFVTSTPRSRPTMPSIRTVLELSSTELSQLADLLVDTIADGASDRLSAAAPLGKVRRLLAEGRESPHRSPVGRDRSAHRGDGSVARSKPGRTAPIGPRSPS